MTAMHHIQTKFILLQPSTIIQRAAPKIAAVLAGFSKRQIDDNNKNDAEDCSSISPYTIRKQTKPLSSVSSNDNIAAATTSSTKTKKSINIPAEDLIEWQTNHMPILSTRQLELSLLEIQRRMNHKTRRRGRNMKNELEQQERLHTRATKQSKCTKSNDNTNNQQPQKKEAAILIPICTVKGIPSILFTRRSASLSSHASQISFPGGYYDEVLDSTSNNAMQYIHDDDDMVGHSNNNEWTKRLVHTAVREMHEELQYDIDSLGSGTGVISHHASFYCKQHYDTTTAADTDTKFNNNNNNLPFITILGQTQPIPSMTGSKVTPIIGTINYDLPSSTSTEFETLFPGNPQETDWIFTIPILDLIKNETSEPLQRWSGRREYSNGNHNDDGNAKNNKKRNKTKQHEYWGPVYPIPNEYIKKQDGDKIWGLTAIVLRPLLRKVFRPVFC